jgi:hypothetical protein
VSTTDHGRGATTKDWMNHGRDVPAAESTWIAVLGPGVTALGIRQAVQVTTARVAATVAALVGEDFRAALVCPGPSALVSATGPRYNPGPGGSPMIRDAVRLVLLASVLLAAPQAAWAQSSVQESPRALDLTYAFLTQSTSSMVGGDLLYWQTVRSFETYEMRALGEVGFTRFDGFTLLTVQGGVRWVFTLNGQPKIRPFVHVLAGLERCCGANALSIQPGGGFFYAYSEAFDIVARIDVRRVNYAEGGDTHQRYSVGLSIPIGAR